MASKDAIVWLLNRILKVKGNKKEEEKKKNFPFSRRVFERDITEDNSSHTNTAVCLLLSNIIDWHPMNWLFWKAL